jgi:hypothetical protein
MAQRRIRGARAVSAVAFSIAEPATVERRRHQRVKLRLTGRFMRSDRREFDCVTIDMSPGGIAFAAEAEVQPGERIVTYLNQVGRLEGVVARIFPGGFAIQTRLPPTKRDRLADQLTWLANRASLGLPEDRRHERLTPRNPRTLLKLADGPEHPAVLADISMSGAAVQVAVRPPLGSRVIVGSTPGQIVRHLEDGVAVEFARPLRPEDFSPEIVL